MPILRRRMLLFFLLSLFCNANIQAQDSLDSTGIFKKRKARKDIELLYNFGHIGHNISVNFTRYLGKKGRHAITGGLKYHLETKIHNKNSVFDGWTFYQQYPRWGQNRTPGRDWKDFINPIIYRTGFTFGYKYTFPNARASSLSPFVFYQLQITIAIPATKFPPGPSYVITQPITTYEQAIGVGIQPKLYKKLNGLVSAGFGKSRFNYESGGFWERSINVRFGITYPLGKTVD